MIKNGDNVILKFSTIWDGKLCRDKGKAYIYPSMERAIQFCHPDHETLVEYTPVKHGCIIQTIDNGKMKRVFSCCNTDFTQLTMWITPRFCPNCGAKMDEC